MTGDQPEVPLHPALLLLGLTALTVGKIARHTGFAEKSRPTKPRTTAALETTIVDVVEEQAPGVITVAEFEEADIREPSPGEEPPEES